MNKSKLTMDAEYRAEQAEKLLEAANKIISEQIDAVATLCAALRTVRDELSDRIDGSTETRGRDTWITGLIAECEAAVVKIARRG